MRAEFIDLRADCENLVDHPLINHYRQNLEIFLDIAERDLILACAKGRQIAEYLTMAVRDRHGTAKNHLDKEIEDLVDKGLLPKDIANGLNFVRILGNRQHGERADIPRRVAEETAAGEDVSEKVTYEAFPVRHVLSSFNCLIAALEWYFCRCSHSIHPQLPSIFREGYQRQLRSRFVSPHPIPHALPTIGHRFIERPTALQELKSALFDDHSRFVVVTAPAGYGKTALVSALLSPLVLHGEWLDPILSGLIFLRCPKNQEGQLTKNTIGLAQIFDSIGKIAGQSEKFASVQCDRELTLHEKLELLLESVQPMEKLWLIVDNFEELLDENARIYTTEIAVFLQVLHERHHPFQVIAISRVEPRCEFFFPVVNLQKGLLPNEAILFLRELGHDCDMGEADDDLLLRLAERVHRIPKAMQSLLFYWREKRVFHTLTQLLEEDELLAEFDRIDSENGQKKLLREHILALPQYCRQALQILSVFREPVCLDCLNFVAPTVQWQGALIVLQRHRLVEPQKIGNKAFFSLHPLVQTVAYELLPNGKKELPYPKRDAEVSEILTRNELHRRAATFFRETASDQASWSGIEDLAMKLQEFHHCCNAGNGAGAASILKDIDYRYLNQWGHFALLRNLREELIPLLDQPAMRVENWLALGRCYRDLGEIKNSLAAYHKALNLAQRLDDWRLYRKCLSGLNHSLQAAGELDAAQKHTEAAYQLLCQHAGPTDLSSVSAALSDLGRIYFKQGKTAQAIPYFERSLALCRIQFTQNRNAEQICYGHLGNAYLQLRQIQDALRCYDLALEIAELEHSPRGIAVNLNGLGRSYLAIGELSRALRYLQRAHDVCAKNGHTRNQIHNLNHMARVYGAQGNLKKGEGLLWQAHRFAEQLEDEKALAIVANIWAELRLINGDVRGAEILCRKCDSLSSRSSTKHIESALWHLNLARIFGGQKKWSQSAESFQKVIDSGLAPTTHRALIGFALLNLRQNRMEEALKLAQQGLEECENLLTHTPCLCSALYMRALGSVVSNNSARTRELFDAALEVCSAPGMISDALSTLQDLESVYSHSQCIRNTVAHLNAISVMS